MVFMTISVSVIELKDGVVDNERWLGFCVIDNPFV